MKRTLLAVALLSAGLAHADGLKPDYYTMSIGQTKLENNTGFGWWQQDSTQHRNSNDTNSWALRAGWQATPALAVEIGYRDLGKHSQAGSWQSDPAYALWIAGQCTLPCGENLGSTYQESKVYGVDVRLKASHAFDVAPSVRFFGTVGIFAYHSQLRLWTIPHDNSGTVPEVYRENENRQRFNYSVGVEYGNAFVEYTIDPHVGTEFSAVNRAQTLHFGVRF